VAAARTEKTAENFILKGEEIFLGIERKRRRMIEF